MMLFYSITLFSVEKVLLKGIVLDKVSGLPVEEAMVKISNYHDYCLTDKNGSYKFRLNPAEYQIEVQMLGYHDYHNKLKLQNGINLNHKIELTPMDISLKEISVTANAHKSNFEALHANTSVIKQQDLEKEYSVSLAKTINKANGVALRSMGEAAARPVIRGLTGDRVIICQDGQPSHDLSSTSADHAVTVDATNADNIDIVKGPKVLLYTSTANGGVIDVNKNLIPDKNYLKNEVAAGLFYESVNNSSSGHATIKIPVTDFGFNAGGNYRKSDNTITPSGKLENTALETGSYFSGMNYFQNSFSLGFVFQEYFNQYGIPGGFIGGHPNGVDIDMTKNDIGIKLISHPEYNLLNDIELSFNRNYYTHIEYESNKSIGAEFLALNYAGTLKLFFNSLNEKRNLIFQLSGSRRDMQFGGYVFTPPTIQSSISPAIYQEMKFGNFELQSAVRFDYNNFMPESAIEKYSNIENKERTFNTFAGSTALLYKFNDSYTASISINRSSRVPTIEELYNQGPHLAAYTFETGCNTLENERGIGYELNNYLNFTNFTAALSLFYNDYDYFITTRNSGEINWQQILPVYKAEGVKAAIYGFETKIELKFLDDFKFENSLNTVYGENLSENKPLSGIPPFKYISELSYAFDETNKIGITNETVLKQNRVDTYEEPTAGYSIFGAYYQSRYRTGSLWHNVTLSLENAQNRRYYNHISRLKSIMPEAGRCFKINYSLMY